MQIQSSNNQSNSHLLIKLLDTDKLRGILERTGMVDNMEKV